MKDNVGVLFPLASLPGNHGIGDFGSASHKFISFLKNKGFHYWQILPLNPLGPGNSPYLSSFSKAIDTRYISLDLIFKDGLISKPKKLKASYHIDYQKVYEYKNNFLLEAYKNYSIKKKNGLLRFIKENPWVKDYGLFKAFEFENNFAPWNKWQDYQINYFKNPVELSLETQNLVNFHIFTQFVAFRQYRKLLKFAHQKNIKIIADMPFYVGFNSLDCWKYPSLFSIDNNNELSEVGGVPPDYFNDEGQLWGSPIYRFDEMEKDHFSWMIDRTSYLAKMADYLRIDHFRAFDTYYVVDASRKDAKVGEWRIGPREKFFDQLFALYPHINILAEDLGDLFKSVYELRDHYHLKGMYVAQFALFDYKMWGNTNYVVYTGTHDNETFYSWFKKLKPHELEILADRSNHPKDLYRGLLKTIYHMPSYITIFPLQDLLLLNNRARINTPGTIGKHNWTYRLKDYKILKKIKMEIFR